MSLDWPQLLNENRISYIERGPNVKRGEINIKCPFCGSADPSYHMGLSLSTGYWACWRNQNHRGKSPLRLIVQLLRVSYWKAREIAGLSKDYVDPDGFDAVAARLMGKGETIVRMEEVRRDFLKFPKEFRTKMTGRHLTYLESRGFPARDLPELCSLYALQCSLEGLFRDRIILPYYVNEELVTWSARTINNHSIRYRDLSIDDSLIPPKKTFYNYDCIARGGEVLLVVEGPLDVLKLDFYGRKYGVRAVGLSTNSITEEQSFLLEEASGQFRKTYFMLDTATQLGIVDSMRLKEKLSHIPELRIIPVPFGYKDGGEMPPRRVIDFSKEVVA